MREIERQKKSERGVRKRGCTRPQDRGVVRGESGEGASHKMEGEEVEEKKRGIMGEMSEDRKKGGGGCREREGVGRS